MHRNCYCMCMANDLVQSIRRTYKKRQFLKWHSVFAGNSKRAESPHEAPLSRISRRSRWRVREAAADAEEAASTACRYQHLQQRWGNSSNSSHSQWPPRSGLSPFAVLCQHPIQWPERVRDSLHTNRYVQFQCVCIYVCTYVHFEGVCYLKGVFQSQKHSPAHGSVAEPLGYSWAPHCQWWKGMSTMKIWLAISIPLDFIFLVCRLYDHKHSCTSLPMHMIPSSVGVPIMIFIGPIMIFIKFIN